MDMRKEVDDKIALNAIRREPLKAQREKAKAKLMLKVFNQMGPKSQTNIFKYKNKYQIMNLVTSLPLFVYRSHVARASKKVS